MCSHRNDSDLRKRRAEQSVYRNHEGIKVSSIRTCRLLKHHPETFRCYVLISQQIRIISYYVRLIFVCRTRMIMPGICRIGICQ